MDEDVACALGRSCGKRMVTRSDADMDACTRTGARIRIGCTHQGCACQRCACQGCMRQGCERQGCERHGCTCLWNACTSETRAPKTRAFGLCEPNLIVC